MTGIDYPMERTLRAGTPFSKVITVTDGVTAGTSLGTIKPDSDAYVLYIDRIYVDLDTNGATFSLVIDGPLKQFVATGATDTGTGISDLINDPAKVVSGTTVKGNIYLTKSLDPAYFYQKGTSTASAGLLACWEVLVNAATTVVGSGKLTLTFVGSQVSNKHGTTNTALGFT